MSTKANPKVKGKIQSHGSDKVKSADYPKPPSRMPTESPNDEVDSYALASKAKEAETEMLVALSQSGIFSTCYAHRSRVKSPEKLRDKKVIKLRKKPNYKMSDITDVIGIRFVTLFRSDMPIVFERLLELISHKADVKPNPFYKDEILEIIVYSALQHDNMPSEIIEIGKKYSRKVEVKIDNPISGYSSIHLVTCLKNSVNLKCADMHNIPVEIQIRTVFEDAWGEIDHKYGYVLREGKEAGVPISNPESVLKHLKILKKFCDASGEYADAIHREAIPQKLEPISTGKVISICADEELVVRLSQLGASKDYVNGYKSARDILADARALDEAKPGAGLSKFFEAAERFRELTLELGACGIDKSNQLDYLYYYYMRMNEAIALLSTNNRESIHGALTIYSELNAEYEDYPLVLMRQGQAYGKLGSIDNALAKCELAYGKLRDLEKSGVKFHDFLTETDYRHIKEFLPSLYGYTLWRKASKLPREDANLPHRIRLYGRAYQVTWSALEYREDSRSGSAADIINLHNNLLYYAIELLKCKTLLEPNKKHKTEMDKVRKHLGKIEQLIDVKGVDDLLWLDTLYKAYELIGRYDDSSALANRLIPMAFEAHDGGFFDKEALFDILKEAHRAVERFQKMPGKAS